MIIVIYNLSQHFFNLSAFHARHGNRVRMVINYYLSQALLHLKTWLQS